MERQLEEGTEMLKARRNAKVRNRRGYTRGKLPRRGSKKTNTGNGEGKAIEQGERLKYSNSIMALLFGYFIDC